MAEFSKFSDSSSSSSTSNDELKLAQKSSSGKVYVDYRQVDELRRLLTPNGKIQSRKRTGLSSREQRMAAQAIKRARYMGLLPYTSATL